MGLRCLIGHEYGEPETTRERDDRGNEVVVTIREYKECARCGERQIISENTEVRAVAPEPEPESEPETGGAADETGREFEDVSAAEDDGIILEDDADERAPGEWPEEDEPEPEDVAPEAVEWPEHGVDDESADAPGEPAAWPEHEGADEGIDAEPPGDAAADVTFGGGLAPDAAGSTDAAEDAPGTPADPGNDAGAEDAADTAPVGIRSSTSGPDPADQRVAGVETALVCPECGHSAAAVDSSLRPGDICPECGRGYLTEREQS